MSRVTTAHFEARTLFAPTFRLRATPPFLFNETRDLSLPSILTILPVVEIRPFIRPVITAEDKKETGERERFYGIWQVGGRFSSLEMYRTARDGRGAGRQRGKK